MITLVASIATFSGLRKALHADPSQTFEEASTSKLIWTIISVLANLFIAFLLFLLARSLPLQSGRLYIERAIAVTAA